MARFAVPTCVLEEETLQFLAALQEILEARAFHPRAEVQCQAFEMNAARGNDLEMIIVDEENPIEINDAKIRCLGFDFANVDRFVDFLFGFGGLFDRADDLQDFQ